MLTAEKIIETLELEKHPREGGYFKEIYRSKAGIDADDLDPGYGDGRSLATAIYYMLAPGTFSEMHRLVGDEIFHFYLGGPVEMLQLFPDGSGKKVVIGPGIEKGQSPQVLVPGGVWQGSRLLPGSEFALLGTTMSPGFDYRDYTSGNREELSRQYAAFKDTIHLLTRSDGG